MERIRLHFFVDEHLPAHAVATLLRARGHEVTPVLIGAKDPAILLTAEEAGAVVILTADRWFLRELFRHPPGHKLGYSRAGVAQIEGEWEIAELNLVTWLPLIETVATIRATQADRRVGIELRATSVYVWGPKVSRSVAGSDR